MVFLAPILRLNSCFNCLLNFGRLCQYFNTQIVEVYSILTVFEKFGLVKMAPVYSKLEKTFLINEFQRTQNAAAVKRNFSAKFRRNGPDKKTVKRILTAFKAGSLDNKKPTGRPRSVRTLANQHVRNN
jgi:Helix-turn-helix domain (DUF4817)